MQKSIMRKTIKESMQPIRLSNLVAVPHLKYFNSKLSHQVDHGGRAAYKSSKNALKIAKLMIEHPTIEVVVFRQDYTDHRDSTFRDLLWAFEMLGVNLEPSKHYPTGNTTSLYIRLPKGNHIHFKQMKVKDKLKGYRPTKPTNSINIAWFFEITEFKDESYVVSARSSIMRESAGDWFICLYEYNDAPKLSHWTYEFANKMRYREDAYVLKTNYNDTPEWQQEEFLGKPLMKEINMLKTIDPEMYKSEYLGFPANLGGTVYKQFSMERNVKEATHNYIDITIGADIGGNDATTYVAKGFKPQYSGMESFDQYYHKNGITGGIKNINEYVQDLLEFARAIYVRHKLPITVYIDSANLMFIQLVEEMSMTNEYRFLIIEKSPKMTKFRHIKKDKSILQGRVDMNEIMYGSGYHTIDPKCKQLIKGTLEREYDKNGNPADDGSSDVDSIDASDYGWLKEGDFIYDTIMSGNITPQQDTNRSDLIE